MHSLILILLTLVSDLEQAKNAMLAKLPSGVYYYEKPQSSEAKDKYLLVRKSGFIVTGVDMQSRVGNLCFRGTVRKNSIFNITRIFPPYDPASKWEFLKGEALNLNHYRKANQVINASDKAALLKCIQVFSER